MKILLDLYNFHTGDKQDTAERLLFSNTGGKGSNKVAKLRKPRGSKSGLCSPRSRGSELARHMPLNKFPLQQKLGP